MAEGNIYSRAERRVEERGKDEEESYVQLEELGIKERPRKGARCESCVIVECPRSERFERVSQWYGRVAIFLCFVCKMYVCEECFPKHRMHEGMKVKRKESEGNGFFAKIKNILQRAEREREKNERKRMRRKFVVDLANESERTRKEKFFKSLAIVYDRVEVKHELDEREDCGITGLCELENIRWVVCDCWNSCIKIFKQGSNVLQRYIRFVESGPWDVTEIQLKQNWTEPNLVFGSSSDISITDQVDPYKHCFIGVTLPGKRQIMFVDLSNRPAKIEKIIKTGKKCFSIQSYDDRIFTVCEEDTDASWSIHILSTDGDTLNKFNTGIYGENEPYLAVVSGRVYLTDGPNDKVQCLNVEGQVLSQITIEGSGPNGISVDPDNIVYVCAWDHNTLYKLNSDLTRYKSVMGQTAGYIDRPWVLSCHRDKLFIGHYDWPPSLRNFVSVVRLL